MKKITVNQLKLGLASIFRLIVIVVLVAIPFQRAMAQQTSVRESSSTQDPLPATLSNADSAPDFAQIEQAILTLFDGMRQSDSMLIQSVIHPDMTLQTTMINPEGEVVLRSTPVPAFVEAAGGPKDAIWDEQISDLIVQQDGPLASAWMHYRFYRGDEFSHCGVNAMMLVKQADGWKITSIVDTRRRQDCN